MGGKFQFRRSIAKVPGTIVTGGGDVVLVEMTDGGEWPDQWKPYIAGNEPLLTLGQGIEDPPHETPIIGNNWAVVP